jgi:hypothetical protein
MSVGMLLDLQLNAGAVEAYVGMLARICVASLAGFALTGHAIFHLISMCRVEALCHLLGMHHLSVCFKTDFQRLCSYARVSGCVLVTHECVVYCSLKDMLYKRRMERQLAAARGQMSGGELPPGEEGVRPARICMVRV